MAEALKTFREGEDILASETNENNQFLLSKLSDNAAQVQSYVEGEVATIKSNVASVQATLQENIDTVNNSVTNLRNKIIKSLTPDYNSRVDIGIPLSGNQYTAPYDGVYFANVQQSNATRYLYVNDKSAFTYSDNIDGTMPQTFYVPLLKGDRIYWSAGIGAKQSSFFKYRATI
jgi:hypothetical protein